MADCSKSHTVVDIKTVPASILSKLDAGFCDEFQENKTPFFKSGSRRRRGGDTWVISIFVMLQIISFIATMFVNDCWSNSHGDCAVKGLGRLAFQPLSENPLLGPSASTLDEMGALRRSFLEQHHQTWRLLTFPMMHAGLIHLIVDLGSVIFVGIQLEQEFGQLSIGTIYILSAFVGTLLAALFIQNTPAVGSSGALYGLIGAMLSSVICNWKIYSHKVAAIVSFIFICLLNFALGLLPYIDNFASIGGLLSGFLLGIILLFNQQFRQAAPNIGGKLENRIRSFLKVKLERPVLRSVSLLIFSLLLAGCLAAVLHGIDLNRYCIWCRYVDCVPSKMWRCQDIASTCETMVSNDQLTLTCLSNGNFKVFAYTNISQARTKDLCSLICS